MFYFFFVFLFFVLQKMFCPEVRVDFSCRMCDMVCCGMYHLEIVFKSYSEIKLVASYLLSLSYVPGQLKYGLSQN